MHIQSTIFIFSASITLFLSGLFSLSSFAAEIKPTTLPFYKITPGQITHTVHLPVIQYTPPKGLIIIKSSYEDRPEFSNYVTYFGEFWNNTDQPIERVTAYFTFYDSTGQVIGIEDTTNSLMTFNSGVRICWKLWVRKSWGEPVLHSKEYEVGQFSGTPHSVRIQNTRLITDEFDFKVIGEIMNGGPDPIRNMRISTTLYNSQRQVVGCDPYAFPQPDPLPIGNIAIFEADSFYDADQKNAISYYVYMNFYRDVSSIATFIQPPTAILEIKKPISAQK